MRSLGLNSDGKLYVDNSGNIGQLTGLEEVVQGCETVMRAQLGEMYYNANSGIPTRGTIWDTYNPLQFIAAGRVALLTVAGVTGIQSFDVEVRDNVFTYTAVVITEYGKGTITNG